MSIFPKYVYKSAWKRTVIFCLDALGFLFFGLFNLFKKRSDAPINRIAAFRLDHIGDVVLTRFALQALRRAFPTAQIDFWCDAAIKPLMEGQGASRIVGVKDHWFDRSKSGKVKKDDLLKQIKAEKYDLGIDFRGDLRTIFLIYQAGIPQRVGFKNAGGGFLLTEAIERPEQGHEAEHCLYLLKGFRVPQEIAGPAPLRGDEMLQKHWAARLKNANDSQIVIIHPGAGYPSKEWGANNYHDLMQRLLQNTDVTLVIVGTQKEKDAYGFDLKNSNILDLRGETTLQDYVAICACAQLFVGSDSGPAHIAASQGINCVVVFSGTNKSERWKPYTQKLNLIEYAVPCSPCESETCPLGHHDCMQKITVDRVFKQALDGLRDRERVV